MIVDTVIENQKFLSQQSSIDKSSTNDHPSMVNTSTDTNYPLTAYTSMDIPSTSNPTLSDTILSTLGTIFDEQIVIYTLLGLSEGEK